MTGRRALRFQREALGRENATAGSALGGRDWRCAESVAPVHKCQLLTYLKLADKRLGLLINYDLVVHYQVGYEAGLDLDLFVGYQDGLLAGEG